MNVCLKGAIELIYLFYFILFNFIYLFINITRKKLTRILRVDKGITTNKEDKSKIILLRK